MANLAQDQLTDEEQQRLLEQQAAAAQGTGAPQSVPGTDEGAAGSGASKSAAGPTAGGSPQSSGLSGFTAVSDYLNANAPQAQDLAGKIAGNLTSQANDITGSISDADTNFKKSVDATAVQPDEALIGEAASDPTGFAQNPDKVASFAKARTANYTGPSTLGETADFGPLQGKVQAGATDAGLVNSEGGRSQLIERLPGTHTAGMNSLDQLLLEQGPGTQATLKAAAAPFAGITDLLNQTKAGAADYASKAKSNTASAAKLVADKFTAPGGAIPTLQNQVTSRVAPTAASRDTFNSEVQDIMSKVGSGNADLTDQELADLGLSPGMLSFANTLSSQLRTNYPGTTPVTYSAYETPGKPIADVPTTANLATPEEYAKVAALEKLMGAPLTFLSQSDSGKAGTYDPTSGKLPEFNLKQAITDAGNKFRDNDINTMNGFFNGGFRTDSFGSWPANVQQAMIRLKQSGVKDNVAPVAFGSNPGTYYFQG